MATAIYKYPLILACKVLGHTPETIREVGQAILEWRCMICKAEFATANVNGTQVTKPLVAENKKLHDALIQLKKPLSELLKDMELDEVIKP